MSISYARIIPTTIRVARVRTLLAFSVMLSLTTSGCAARGPIGASTFAEGSAGGTLASAPRIVVLVGAELAMAGTDQSLYDAVHRLRPDVLRWRQLHMGESGSVLPMVYVNGARVGDSDALRGIKVGRARKVQLIPADEAVRRYGPGHEAGAILVTVIPPFG